MVPPFNIFLGVKRYNCWMQNRLFIFEVELWTTPCIHSQASWSNSFLANQIFFWQCLPIEVTVKSVIKCPQKHPPEHEHTTNRRQQLFETVIHHKISMTFEWIQNAFNRIVFDCFPFSRTLYSPISVSCMIFSHFQRMNRDRSFEIGGGVCLGLQLSIICQGYAD